MILKCRNCSWKGSEDGLDTWLHCPECGDFTNQIEEEKEEKGLKKQNDDRAIIESKRGKDGKFTKTDVKDFNKRQQLLILQDLGLTDEKIKKLSSEDKRINKIMRLQK